MSIYIYYIYYTLHYIHIYTIYTYIYTFYINVYVYRYFMCMYIYIHIKSCICVQRNVCTLSGIRVFVVNTRAFVYSGITRIVADVRLCVCTTGV